MTIFLPTETGVSAFNDIIRKREYGAHLRDPNATTRIVMSDEAIVALQIKMHLQQKGYQVVGTFASATKPFRTSNRSVSGFGPYGFETTWSDGRH